MPCAPATRPLRASHPPHFVDARHRARARRPSGIARRCVPRCALRAARREGFFALSGQACRERRRAPPRLARARAHLDHRGTEAFARTEKPEKPRPRDGQHARGAIGQLQAPETRAARAPRVWRRRSGDEEGRRGRDCGGGRQSHTSGSRQGAQEGLDRRRVRPEVGSGLHGLDLLQNHVGERASEAALGGLDVEHGNLAVLDDGREAPAAAVAQHGERLVG